MQQSMFTFFKKIKVSLVILCCISIVLLPAQSYEHFILYGQSLSTGHQSWPPLSTTPVSGNFMLGNQVWTNLGNSNLTILKPLTANVAATTTSLPKTRASMICAEAPIVTAVNHIQLKTNGQMQMIATSSGYGGRSIEQLSKEHYNPTHYADFIKAVNYAGSTTKNNIHCPAIIWMQGEYNYATYNSTGLTEGSKPTEDKATYKALQLTLKNNMQSDIMTRYKQSDEPLFITYQVGAQYSRGKTLAIGMAQLESSNEHADVICAGPVYPMTDRGGHLDSNGYRWYGEMIGKAYYQTKILGQDFKPLQPMELARTENKRELRIKFLVPQLPLVLDESLVKKVTNYGFEVHLNDVKQSISNVRVDGAYVYLSCVNELNGDIEVIYAGINTSGNGNLRDSDEYSAYYNYIDLDQKNENGAYVYARENNETTLRPAYEPRDESGVIYDKPYPLFNFSVAFYYQLKAGDQVYQVPHLDPNTAIDPPSIAYNTNVSYMDGSLSVATSLSDYKGIELMDLSGKRIIAHNEAKVIEELTYHYNVPQLSSGIYLIKVMSANSHQTSKLMVQ